jgi:hypothetical protein
VRLATIILVVLVSGLVAAVTMAWLTGRMFLETHRHPKDRLDDVVIQRLLEGNEEDEC